ncbi:helix-turn-helix domain-containing protein [Mesorhizobium sp. J428]|uniref:helix-turn-helix domain-containing protein n=1 Tax=Mesorhizobium sp. J428 TaxID=2898440 RepID=UPI0021516092|nr:helix-turn-helix domain-containing protein [Mesorhizobium sp. J428]MCR5855953.1 helix-turn-helix domain-containing protein [Mesorhizobium sp. J428]
MARRIWNRHTILAELRSRGMTLAKLAEIYEISPHSVCHVWKRPNAKAEAAIADFLGVPAEELFEFDGRYPKRTAVVLSSKYDTPPASPNPNGRAAA